MSVKFSNAGARDKIDLARLFGRNKCQKILHHRDPESGQHEACSRFRKLSNMLKQQINVAILGKMKRCLQSRMKAIATRMLGNSD